MSVPDVKGIVFLNLYYFYEFMGKMMQVSSTQGFFEEKFLKISNNTNWLFCHIEVKIWTTLN